MRLSQLAAHPMRLPLALGVALAATLGLGCTSQDRHVFESPAYRPVTITVLDGVDREPIWSYDIPPGYILTLDTDADLRPQQNYAGGNRATELKWAVRDPNSREGPFDRHLHPPVESGEMFFDPPKNLLLSYDIRRPIPKATADRFERTDLPTGQQVPATLPPGFDSDQPEPGPASPETPAAAPNEPEAVISLPADSSEAEMATPAELEPEEAQPVETDEPAASDVNSEIDLLEGIMDK
ncbi:MAG: hypothetical protein AAFY08_13585 [Planctomycetota bacterium]